MSIDSIWAEMQGIEKESKREYNSRYKSAKAKSNVSSLTDLMSSSNINKISSTTQKTSKIKTKLNDNDSKTVTTSSSNLLDINNTNQLNECSISTPDNNAVNNTKNCLSEPVPESQLELKLEVEPQSHISTIDHARTLNLLSSDLTTDRKTGLTNLYNHLITATTTTPTTTTTSTVYTIKEYNTLLTNYSKILFKIFSQDKIEKHRELSLKILIKFFENSTDYSYIIGYYFPCLFNCLASGHNYDPELKVFVNNTNEHEAYLRGRAVDRQDKQHTTHTTNTTHIITNKKDSATTNTNNSVSYTGHIIYETSEENRLLLCNTLYILIQRTILLKSTSLLHSYFQDIILCIQYQTNDTYPEVKILVCILLSILSQESEFELGMKYYAVGLVRVLLPLLRHRHSKVRIAAVTGI